MQISGSNHSISDPESIQPGFLIIVQSVAAGKKKRLLDCFINRLHSSAIPFEIVSTRSAGHANQLAKSGLEQGYRRFISAGGDGTNFEVLNGLFGSEIRTDISLGFLPIGTGNSFVRDFGNFDHCVESIVQNRQRNIDVVELIHQDGKLYFMNLMSLGFIAKVAAFRNRFLRPLGSAGYVVAVLTNILRDKSYSLNYRLPNADNNDLPRVQSLFVSFSNSRFTGGKMLMAPQADPSDGLVDIVHAHPMPNLSLLATFPKIFSGNHVHSPFIKTSRTCQVTFDDCSCQPMMIDGEVLEVAPRQLIVHRQCLTIYS